MFFKNILKSKAGDESIQARKELYCHITVKNYLCNVLWKFLIKIESMWRHKIEEQAPQLTFLYCGRTVRSSTRDVLEKPVLKNFAISTGNTFVGVYFLKIAGLKACNFIRKKPQQSCFPVNIAKFLRLSILKNICN